MDFQDSSTVFVRNSLIKSCGGSTNWNPAFGVDGSYNLDQEVYFVSPDQEDFRLRENSPALNAGYSFFHNNIGYYRGPGVEGEVGFAKLEKAPALLAYPNPVTDRLFLQWTDSEPEEFQIKILNIQGQVILSEVWNQKQEGSIDFSSYTPGIYHISVSVGPRTEVISIIKR